MNKKLIIVLAILVIVLTAVIGALLSRKNSQQTVPPMPKLVKPDTSAPHFPE